ncbi:MAG: saccharopine dehydrogenase family protein, partial [Candidatus Micrarchaeales archaeon]
AEQFARSFKKSNVVGVAADSSNKLQMRSALKDANVLINATNYYANLQVMGDALQHNVNYIDLGGMYWMTQKQLKLHNKFKKKNIVAVLGCGSTPGITNVLAEYGAKRFDRINSLDVAFADKDYTQYTQPFVVPYSMQTIFDEFTMNPRILLKGKIKLIKPLTDAKHFDFPKPVGRVLCRCTLHSELASLPETLHNKGIRECSFRGSWDESFVRECKFLIDTGFASREKITVGNKDIAPRDISVALLNKFQPSSKAKINDTEFLRVEIVGTKNGKRKRLIVYCQAFTNKKYNIPAGAWDTGVPPSIIAQEIIKGQVKGKGVLTPERCITPILFFKALKKRKMRVFTRSK